MYVRWQWTSKAICRNKVPEKSLCSGRYYNFDLFLFGATDSYWPGPPHSRGFYITHNDAPQLVGLLWTCDQPVAETSTWTKHYTHNRQTSMSPVEFETKISAGERLLRLTARPLGSAQLRPLPIQNELLLATSVILWRHMFMNVYIFYETVIRHFPLRALVYKRGKTEGWSVQIIIKNGNGLICELKSRFYKSHI